MIGHLNKGLLYIEINIHMRRRGREGLWERTVGEEEKQGEGDCSGMGKEMGVGEGEEGEESGKGDGSG